MAKPNGTHAEDPVAQAEGEPHLIARLRNQAIAIPIGRVREIAPMPAVVPIPLAPPYVRGVIRLRGEVIPVVDLRVRLGLTSRGREIAEVIGLLRQREQDHLDWVNELEGSVRESRPFTLTRDPHMCKFGQWYDTYQPDVGALAFMWTGFDKPHRHVHALGDAVIALMEQGRADEALARIQAARDGRLLALRTLFADAVRALSRDARELAVVLVHGERPLAISVDSAESVELLRQGDPVDSTTFGTGAEPSGLVQRTLRRLEDDEILFELEMDRLMPRADAPSPEAIAA